MKREKLQKVLKRLIFFAYRSVLSCWMTLSPPKRRMSCGMEPALIITARHLSLSTVDFLKTFHIYIHVLGSTPASENPTQCQTCWSYWNKDWGCFPTECAHGGEAARVANVFAILIFSNGKTCMGYHYGQSCKGFLVWEAVLSSRKSQAKTIS